MSEKRLFNKPKELLDQAVRTVRGDNATQLMEAFTSEMTLVAEGLADDQSKIRQELRRLEKDQEETRVQTQTSCDAMTSALQENQQSLDRKLTDLNRRLDALESQLKSRAARDSKQGLIRQATILVGMVCATVLLVSILRLFA